jgi:hypothetical protein
VQVMFLRWAALATDFWLFRHRTHAARIAVDQSEAAAVEAVLDSAVQSSKSPVSLRSLTSRSKPLRDASASNRSQTKPLSKEASSMPSHGSREDPSIHPPKLTSLSEDARLRFSQTMRGSGVLLS